MPIFRLDDAGRILPAGQPRRRTGSSRAWRKVRAAVLERDGWSCRYCGGPATEVDHVVPRQGARLGADDPANLVAACLPCNRAKGGEGHENL